MSETQYFSNGTWKKNLGPALSGLGHGIIVFAGGGGVATDINRKVLGIIVLIGVGFSLIGDFITKLMTNSPPTT
jgi:hypothetical protein